MASGTLMANGRTWTGTGWADEIAEPSPFVQLSRVDFPLRTDYPTSAVFESIDPIKNFFGHLVDGDKATERLDPPLAKGVGCK